MSQGKFFAWKTKQSGQTVSESRRLLAVHMPDLAAMNELLLNNRDARREA